MKTNLLKRLRQFYIHPYLENEILKLKEKKAKTMDMTVEKYYDDNLENYNLLNKIDPMTAKQAMQMMEEYHQAKLKLLGIANVVGNKPTDLKTKILNNRNMINWKIVEKELPREGEWYLVKCPEYSESGFEIAQWDGEEWQHGHFSQSCNKYVTGYCAIPLDEM